MSPKQKALVTALVKSTGVITLGIGDGANDVSMIQEAHIGARSRSHALTRAGGHALTCAGGHALIGSTARQAEMLLSASLSARAKLPSVMVAEEGRGSWAWGAVQLVGRNALACQHSNSRPVVQYLVGCVVCPAPHKHNQQGGAGGPQAWASAGRRACRPS